MLYQERVHTVVYGVHRLTVEAALNPDEIRDSIANIFPEIRGAGYTIENGVMTFSHSKKQTPQQKHPERYIADNDIRRVTYTSKLRNKSTLELPENHGLSINEIKEHLESFGVKIDNYSSSARVDFLGTKRIRHLYLCEEEKADFFSDYLTTSHRKISQEASHVDSLVNQLNEKLNRITRRRGKTFAIVGGEYAKKGSYEHLVGKEVIVFSHNEDLDVYTVAEDKDGATQYAIRSVDITIQK